MSDVKVKVSAADGSTLGFFVNPKIENLCAGDFQISGEFRDALGNLLDKIDFNPEAVPYTVDLSPCALVSLRRLEKVYVQRGRQPVIMTGRKV